MGPSVIGGKILASLVLEESVSSRGTEGRARSELRLKIESRRLLLCAFQSSRRQDLKTSKPERVTTGTLYNPLQIEKMRYSMRLLTVSLCLLAFSSVGVCSSANMIKVTLLGTGTPFPNAARFGSAILVEAGGEKLLFDCGRGAVIRLSQAGVALNSIDALFLTHLHSDHTVGIPDLWLTGWFLGRDHPLKVWGPPGTREMTHHLSLAYQFDVQTREHTENLPPEGAEIDSKEIEQGDVYVHGPLRVSAFLVDHGPVKPAFGYRVDYSGHAVVISGDTRFSQNLVTFSKGADCLIHVAWMGGSRNPNPEALRSLASGEDAGRVFAAVKPKLGVIYHYKDEVGLADAVRGQYQGPFVIAQDLMNIEIERETTWHPGTPDLPKNTR